MDYNANVVGLFILLGVLVQAAIILRKKFFWRFNYALLFVAAIFGFVFSLGQPTGIALFVFVPFFALCYAAFFTGFFRKYFMDKVTEQRLLQLTVIFWFFLLVIFPNQTWLYLAAIASVFVFAVAFTGIKPPPWAKLVLGVWTIVMNFVMSGFLLLNIIQNFGKDAIAGEFSFAVDSFFIGMLFLLLAADLLLLWVLFPLHNKRKPLKEQVEESKEMANAIIGQYLDKDLPLWAAVAIIVLQGGILAANYYLAVVPNLTLVLLSLAVANNLGAFAMPKKVEANDAFAGPGNAV